MLTSLSSSLLAFAVWWALYLYRTRQVIMDEVTGTPYLIRYFIWRSGNKGRIYLHHIMRSDYDRALHSHPWAFRSFILWNGYREIAPRVDVVKHLSLPQTFGWAVDAENNDLLFKDFKAPATVLRAAAWRHRLELKNGKPAWTLVFTSEKQMEWGFWTSLTQFCPWKRYDPRKGICDDEQTS